MEWLSTGESMVLVFGELPCGTLVRALEWRSDICSGFRGKADRQ